MELSRRDFLDSALYRAIEELDRLEAARKAREESAASMVAEPAKQPAELSEQQPNSASPRVEPLRAPAFAGSKHPNGGSGGTYLFLTGLRSASEIDAGFEHGKQFEAALGEHGLRRLGELEAASVDSSDHQLFVFNPKMSYVSDEYVKADAEFWARRRNPR